MEKYFSEILISGEYRVNKPDPDIFLEMCRRLNLRASEGVYIGDSMYHDVKGAVSAGMKAIWVRHDEKIMCKEDCMTVCNVEELISIL